VVLLKFDDARRRAPGQPVTAQEEQLKSIIEKTYWVNIYLSGPVEIAEQICRKDFLDHGLCITITPTKYIYTGGEESGYVIGLVNYPRFPSQPEEIYARAKDLAIKLLDGTFQHSVLLVSPDKSEWITKREQ
jgi:hypothetical protein